MATVGDLATFSIRQEAALQACEARRAAVVAIVDAVDQEVAPRPWWRIR